MPGFTPIAEHALIQDLDGDNRAEFILAQSAEKRWILYYRSADKTVEQALSADLIGETPFVLSADKETLLTTHNRQQGQLSYWSINAEAGEKTGFIPLAAGQYILVEDLS